MAEQKTGYDFDFSYLSSSKEPRVRRIHPSLRRAVSLVAMTVFFTGIATTTDRQDVHTDPIAMATGNVTHQRFVSPRYPYDHTVESNAKYAEVLNVQSQAQEVLITLANLVLVDWRNRQDKRVKAMEESNQGSIGIMTTHGNGYIPPNTVIITDRIGGTHAQTIMASFDQNPNGSADLSQVDDVAVLGATGTKYISIYKNGEVSISNLLGGISVLDPQDSQSQISLIGHELDILQGMIPYSS